MPNGLNDVGGSDSVNASNFTGPDDKRNYYGVYFEDNWKINSKLTLEIGLRWEFYGQVVTGENPQNFVPFPDFARGSSYITTQGNGNYNGLQLSFERRFSQGMNLLANYTYSKCRTDSYQLLGSEAAAGYRAPYLPGFGVHGDYSLCGQDVPNVVHVSGSYQLPLGKGQRFAGSASGAVNQIIGGWSVNWILTLQDGFPFNIGCPVSTTPGFGCTALLVPGQNVYSGPHNVNQWVNPAAFTQPCQLGSSGPIAGAPAGYVPLTGVGLLGGAHTQALGSGFHRLDFSLFKQFKTSETTQLQFRAEFFNLTNTPSFIFRLTRISPTKRPLARSPACEMGRMIRGKSSSH